jgi:autotransporter-associated beta strand protein
MMQNVMQNEIKRHCLFSSTMREERYFPGTWSNDFRCGVALIYSFAGRLTRHGRFQCPSSRTSRDFRQLLWSTGLAVLVVPMLAASDTARAAIVMSNLTSGTLTANDAGGDTTYSKTSSYAVAAGNILVVQLDLYTNTNTGADIAPTATYNGSAGTLISQMVGATGGYPQADIFVFNNPTVGTNNLVLNFTARSATYGAMELSGVNTAATPGTAATASSSNATPNVLTFSGTNAAAINGSFAVVAQASRDTGANNYVLGTNAAGATATQLFNFWGGAQFGSGGGDVASIPSGSFTISSTQTAFNNSANRFVTAGAVFTANIGTLAWTGTAGSGNWDIGATKNWQNASTLGYYVEPNNGVVFDDSAGTAGGTTNVVVTQAVSPQSVMFNNNTYPYTLTAGGGAISGGGAVTLSGSGIVKLNMANSYSGGTTVSAGTLAIGNANGSATGTGPVVIAAGATLTGSGFISTSGTNTVTVNGAITPEYSLGTYNTLTTSALNLNSGSTLNLSFSTTLPNQHDLINVTGALTLASGTININVANLSGTWTPGTYPLANYGTLAGNPAFNLVNVAGALGSSQMSIDESVNHVISLDVLSAAASNTLSWVGNVNTGGSFLWDIGNTLNWSNSGSTSAYNEGNRVVFSNTASNFVVTLNQQVNPSSVTFGNLSHSYTLAGSGGISSATFGMAVNGGGGVTFLNNNAYTSATAVTNGSTLTVNGSLPNSNVFVTGASIGGTGQLAATPASLTLNGATALTAGSNLSVFGATNVASGTFTIPTGATLSGSGGINVSPGAQLVLNGVAGVNQIVSLNGAFLSGSGTIGGGLSNNGTSSITSGTISAGGAWTGSGAINVLGGSELLLGGAASTGSNLTLSVSGTLTGPGAVNSPVNVSGGAIVAISAGTVPILNVASSNLTNGVTAGPGTMVGTTSLGVSGGLVTLNNTNTIPSAALSGGTTNLAGPNVTVATVSSSNTVVNVTGGSMPTLNVANSSPVGGVTVGIGASAGSTALSVSGGLVTLNNTNGIPTAALTGGTTILAGPTVAVATVSGGNTVVNVTGGSVPTLNVANSSPAGGVTVGVGASAGSTALSISGGLVTMNNTNTIPAAALSGGTTNLSGPSVTLANVSAAAVVNVNKGSVAALNVNGGFTSLSSSATVNNLLVTSGTVNLPIGTTTVGTADFGFASNTTYVSPRQLLITNQLKFNGGNTATTSNGNTFTYVTSGTNMASSSPPGTLTFSGGVLTLTPFLGSVNGTAINVFAAGNPQNVSYTGPGPSSDTGTIWNRPAVNATTNNLVNSFGSATTISYTNAGNTGSYNNDVPGNGGYPGNPNPLLAAYAYGPTQTFTFGGLTPGMQYNLYAIDNNNGVGPPGRTTTFTTGGSSQTVTVQANWATVAITAPTVYALFTGLTASASGTLTLSTSGPGEVDTNGLQLVPVFTSGNANFANTNVVAPAGSTLDFGGCGPANAIGGLSLAGNVAVQNVSSGGSVQVGGDVVASANATVSLAAGAGSVPVLVLSGNTNGIQNISAANGTTLTLPALSISSGTVNVGNTTGYNGKVVFNGATPLTASGVAVTVNAGTLKVGGTLSGAAGASLQVRAGTTLAGGPAGAIGIPVTVQTGATFAPDASAASTALFTGSLSISPSAAFQWSYTSGSAEATLALGSAVLNLPGSGNPVFRPQFVIAPVLPINVMTWNTPPANQPAWNFDGSLVAAGNVAVWNDANGTWDTGANWLYPSYTSATLTYQSNGLQLTGLGVTNVTGTAAPAAGANVLIAPPSTSSVAVTGPAAPVVLGALVIEGSGAATASLTLQSGGTISPTSVTAYAGGALAANAAALNMPSGVLAISGGSASLGSSLTLVGTATTSSGTLSLGGGSVGTANATGGVLGLGGGTLGALIAGGGAIGISGATVANAQISGTAIVNATAGALTLLNASGGTTTVNAPASVGSATVSGGVVSLNNTNAMAGLTVSGGSVALNNSSTIATAALSGGTTSLAGPTVTAATISGGAIVNITAGSVPTLNVVTSDLTHDVTVGGGASAGSTSLSVSGGLLTLNNTNTIPAATFSGGTTTVAGPTVTSLGVSGSATVNIGAANTVSGATLIGGGTVNVADPGGLGLQQSTVTVNSNNGLAFSGSSAALGGLSGAGNFSLPSAVLTVGANNANTSYGGVLSGGGGLAKAGSGTFVLSSSNTYAGPTLISAGTLKLTSGVSGFGGNGAGWTVTNGANAPTATAIAANVLTLTDNGPPIFETRSAFYNTKVPTGAFTASFVYTAAGLMQADGVTFTLQNSPAGPAALGPNAAGSNLGYFGIAPSAAIQFNIYSGDPGGVGSAFTTGGTLSAYTSTSPVNLAGGDPIQVTLSYDGSNLVENLTDQTTSQTYSKTYAGVNLPAATGGTSAYVGFTGATGGEFAIQTISNFSFIAGLGNGNLSGLPAATALKISASAVFDLAGANQTIASLSDGAGGGSVINSAPTLPSILTLSPTGGSTTFSGSILSGGTLGAIELVQNGSGTQVLSGANTYTGGTVVASGELILQSSSAILDGSSLTVGAGAAAFSAPIVGAPAVVPEPGALGLLAAAGAALLVYSVRSKRAKP